MDSSIKISGTLEWAGSNENILFGCPHKCRYCYAKAMSIRHKSIDIKRWDDPVLRHEKLVKKFRRRSKPIMFPTTHDIHPDFLDESIRFLKSIVKPGNNVLIVSKPHIDCISRICDEFKDYRDQILFRFSIGSVYGHILRFWEPDTPSLMERLSCLESAYHKDFQTSISCEPILDDEIHRVIEMVDPYVTDTIWLGLMKHGMTRCKVNGHKDQETIDAVQELNDWFTDARIEALYQSLKANPKIRWKDSIKKVVGIETPREIGLDI